MSEVPGGLHVCLFDRGCWSHWWQFGMPMRIYWGDHRQYFITVWPFTGNLISKWRWEDM